MIDFFRRTSFETRKQCQNFLQILQTLALLRRVRVVCESLNFVTGSILPAGQRVELGLRENDLFVRPTHGDKLTNKWHLQLALHLLALIAARMFGEPMRERINKSEVPVHVLILDEGAAHDDLRNQNERDDIGRRFRIGNERRNEQTERHTAHRRHEHDSKVKPEHAADLQDVIPDQDKKHALNEGKYTEGDRL